jgi:hypothetical protein
LDEVLVESSLISKDDIEKEKNILINEIVKNIGMEFFNIPIKNYKLAASTQFLLNEMRNNLKHSTPEDRIKLKIILTENIQKIPQKEEVLKIDNLTMKILKEKYIKKYSSILSENQQSILVKWNEFLANNDKVFLSSFIKEEYKKINKELEAFMQTNSKYENISLLKEAKEKIKNSSLKTVDEESIYETMRYWDLIEDLNLETREND